MGARRTQGCARASAAVTRALVSLVSMRDTSSLASGDTWPQYSGWNSYSTFCTQTNNNGAQLRERVR